MVVRRRSRGTVLVALALVASACGTAGAESTSADTTASSQPTTTAPRPTSTTTQPSTTIPTTTTIANPHETLTAIARSSLQSLVAYDAPNGNPIALPFRVPNPHQFGGPLTMMVTEGDRDDAWLKVQLPIRPNGTEAWIPASHYRIRSTVAHAEVDLSTTSVKIFHDGVLLKESQAAIGAEATPTPLGTFFVAAKRRNPPAEAHLGTWAVVLSGFSETLETFSGGLPVIAIHGANEPDRVLGQSISNGCVRVPNDVIQFLADNMPLGAPVIITA